MLFNHLSHFLVNYQKMHNENPNSSSEKANNSNDHDVIIVTLVPQKKGLFLKHSEYEVGV